MAGYPLMRPIVPDPYPGDFDTISDFTYETRLVLAREPEELQEAARAEISYIVDED